MNKDLIALEQIFRRTKEAILRFSEILQPVVDHAKDAHERLYFHHILEEEEQRLERLDILLPILEQSADSASLSQNQYVILMQELNLEKFGLHNFREHLDLALFEFQDEERETLLKSMRVTTQNDYLNVKQMMEQLGNQFTEQTASGNTNLKETVTDSPPPAKKFTVGSLKQNN
jgi:hypothetical protein